MKPHPRKRQEILLSDGDSRSPFAEIPSEIGIYARWACPELVGAVEYREFGVTLRHPSWKARPFRDLGGSPVAFPRRVRTGTDRTSHCEELRERTAVLIKKCRSPRVPFRPCR